MRTAIRRLLQLTLLAVALCWTAPSSYASIALGVCAGGSSSGAGATLTVNIAPTAGNALIAYVYVDNSAMTITSVKDSAGNSFTVQTNVLVHAGTNRLAGSYLTNVASGLTSVVLTLSGNSEKAMAICEYSGLHTSPEDAYDSVGTYNGSTGNTWATNAMTPSAGLNEVVIGIGADRNAGGAVTCSGSFTREVSVTGGGLTTMAFCDQLVASTTGSYTVTGGNVNNEVLDAVGGTYKAAAAGAGGGGIGGKSGLGGKFGIGD